MNTSEVNRGRYVILFMRRVLAANFSVRGSESQDRVQTTESERIRNRRSHLLRAGLVGNVIEIAFRIALVVVHRWRQFSVMKRQNRGHRLERPRSAQGVPMHGFRGA